MKIAEALGVEFRLHRNQKNIAQIDIAVAADIERSYVSAIENGKHDISMSMFIRLCDGLEVESRDILDSALKRMGR